MGRGRSAEPRHREEEEGAPDLYFLVQTAMAR